VKDPVGIGKLLTHNFFAPLNDSNDLTAAEEINYNYKSMPDELSLL
jgi:hypothetical protein